VRRYSKHFNLRTAYKYYDIGTDYLSGNFQRPQAKASFVWEFEYETIIKEKKANNGSLIIR
jgi:hypothetical protein